MTGIREQKKHKTREKIIAAAVELFTEKGFERTSLEDIATHAGIGKATVYTYFEGKGDIFLTYCDDELDEAFNHINIVQGENLSLVDQLVGFFMKKFKFITKDKEFGRQLLQEMMFPKLANDKVKEHDQRYFDILNILLRSAQDRGEISKDQDLFFLGVHFFSLYLGILAGWYCDYIQTDDETEDAMRRLFQQAIEGVGR